MCKYKDSHSISLLWVLLKHAQYFTYFSLLLAWEINSSNPCETLNFSIGRSKIARIQTAI